MILMLECHNCGFKWEKNVYMRASLDSECCPKCKDTKLKVRDKEEHTIDAYKGCPPFEEDRNAPEDGMGVIHDYITLKNL